MSSRHASTLSGVRHCACILLALALAGTPTGLGAQDGDLVDRVAAVVGDSVITLSQVTERIFQLEYQGVEVPSEGAARARLQRETLDMMIGEQLIVQAALNDTTIFVDEMELDGMVAEDIQGRVSSYEGGQVAFRQALLGQGWTLASYREFLRGQARQQLLYQQYMRKRSRDLSGIMVEESELRAFFEEQEGQLGERPPTIGFTQIIILTEPSDSAKAEALTEAERIRQMAVDGDDFEELARRFSEDPGSRENGGDMGWFRRGDMVEAFEEAAFSAPLDLVTPPVESPFGFHLIKVERRRPSEVKARHILISAPASPADADVAREKALTVLTRLQSGEDYVALREEFGEELAPDTLEVPVNRLNELPPGFGEQLMGCEENQFFGPIEYEAQGSTRFGVVHVHEVRDEGTYTFEDVRPQIRTRIQEEKLFELVLEELRARIYVQIRI